MAERLVAHGDDHAGRWSERKRRRDGDGERWRGHRKHLVHVDRHAEIDAADDPTPRALVYYLAEGATGAFFDTDLLLANPHAVEAPVIIEFLRSDGVTIVLNQTLAPLSRATVRLDEVPGLDGNGATASTKVTSSAGLALAVERTMRWDASGYGAHTEKATAGAAREWYFAEGAQGFFSTYLLLANPHAIANVAHVTWLREGEPALTRDYSLPPSSRVTVDTANEPELAGRAFGAHVAFERPGAAERAMYFGASPFWSGGHASAGRDRAVDALAACGRRDRKLLHDVRVDRESE